MLTEPLRVTEESEQQSPVKPLMVIDESGRRRLAEPLQVIEESEQQGPAKPLWVSAESGWRSLAELLRVLEEIEHQAQECRSECLEKASNKASLLTTSPLVTSRVLAYKRMSFTQ
ncbi:hypothetical protein NDU88_002652 [Pleurodeles waltl]|uniref:Uncharacterized protein n=1 Tax=Pleurodeles waltl TaxID=8319 RepID=A0AAV7KW93_PLEWA|nr:hypothetical protein NDU88_002652 [Pleurodeles waltl]